MDYERLSKSNEFGLSKIYELVINNNPATCMLEPPLWLFLCDLDPIGTCCMREMKTARNEPESAHGLPRRRGGDLMIIAGRFRADGPPKAALLALAIHHGRSILLAITVAVACAYGFWPTATQLKKGLESRVYVLSQVLTRNASSKPGETP